MADEIEKDKNGKQPTITPADARILDLVFDPGKV